jgi:hypothetical protein
LVVEILCGQQQQQCPPDSVVVAEALRKFGSITDGDVRKFIGSCLNGSGRYSETEIAELVNQLGSTFSAKTKNPIGVLLAKVPEALPGRIAAIRKQDEFIEQENRRIAAFDFEQSKRAAEYIFKYPEDASDEDRQWAAEFLEANK